MSVLCRSLMCRICTEDADMSDTSIVNDVNGVVVVRDDRSRSGFSDPSKSCCWMKLQSISMSSAEWIFSVRMLPP